MERDEGSERSESGVAGLSERKGAVPVEGAGAGLAGMEGAAPAGRAEA